MNCTSRRLLSTTLLLLLCFVKIQAVRTVYSESSLQSGKGPRRRLTTTEQDSGAENLSGLNFLKQVGKGLRRKIQYAKSETLAELDRDPRQEQGVLSFQTATNYAYQYGDDIINAVKTDGFQKRLGTQSVGTSPDEVFQEGFEQGISHGLVQGVQSGFNAGFDAGFQIGFQNGFEQGLQNGILAAPVEAPKPNKSVDVLFLEGYSNGYQVLRGEGLKEGFSAGLQERHKASDSDELRTSLGDPMRAMSTEENAWLKPDFVESSTPSETVIKPIDDARSSRPEAGGVTPVFSESTLTEIKDVLGRQSNDEAESRTRVPYNDEALERDLEQALTLLYSGEADALSSSETATAERVLEALDNVLTNGVNSQIPRNQDLLAELQNWKKRRESPTQDMRETDANNHTEKEQIQLERITFQSTSNLNTPFLETEAPPQNQTTTSEQKTTGSPKNTEIIFVVIIPIVVCLLAGCIGSVILWWQRQ